MGGSEWSPEEDALLVFFASSGVQAKVIVNLLSLRGYSRSLIAVHNRARSLRNTHGLGLSRQWYQEATEDWLSRHLASHCLSVSILQPTVADQIYIQQVNFPPMACGWELIQQ